MKPKAKNCPLCGTSTDNIICNSCTDQARNEGFTKAQIEKICEGITCHFCQTNRAATFTWDKTTGEIYHFFCEECWKERPTKKMVEHVFWCLDEDNQVLTPGDRDRVERLLKQLPDRTMWLKKEFKTVANFFHSHTGMWWFPCMRDNGKKVLVSKTLKDTFRRKSQYEICRGWCPFGNYADQYRCKLWDERYKNKWGMYEVR
jgi:hypothetical protein